MRINNSVDYCKGNLIFLVTLGHVLQVLAVSDSVFRFYDYPLVKLIYSFHMPMFFFLSGQFFCGSIQRGIKEFIQKKMIRLLHPIFIWNTISYIFTIVYCIFFNEETEISIKGYIERLSGLWFLWAMLSTSIILALCVEWTKRTVVGKTVILLCILAVICFFPNSTYMIWLMPYYVFGIIYKKFFYKVKQDNIIYILFVGIVFLIVVFFFKEESFIYITGIYSSKLGVKASLRNDLYRWCVGLLGTYSMYLIWNKMYRIIPDRVRSLFCHLGRNSMKFYVVQTIVVSSLLNRIYAYIYNCGLIAFDGLQVIVVSIFTSILCLFLMERLIRIVSKYKVVDILLFGVSDK